MNRLYVVATPIGNLEDVSLRALRVLAGVSLVAAEDTRTAGVFLRHHGLNPRLVSYTDHNKRQRIPQILERLAEGDVALVTDAGTPAISDPGVDLVAAARSAGHEVLAIPGPSAPVAAMSVAGLAGTAFRFVGFLPRSAGELRTLLEEAAGRPEVLIAFEAPGRLRRSLQAIDAAMPERGMAVCRELTKLHEETFVGTAAQALAHFAEPRGEIVLLIEGASGSGATPEDDESALREEVAEMRRLGLTRSQAMTLLSKRYDTPRRRLYELWLEAEPRNGGR
jgi:16S rRNA (cytidine1402-2'-O)-methyltransferase